MSAWENLIEDWSGFPLEAFIISQLAHATALEGEGLKPRSKFVHIIDEGKALMLREFILYP